MASWIALDEELWNSPKVRNLRRILDLGTKREVIGIVASLWRFTLQNAWRDANLEPWGAEGIAEACEWEGDAQKFVTALRECGKVKDGERGPGFLDGWIVHDWMKHARKLVKDRLWREKQKQAGADGKVSVSQAVLDVWNEFAEEHKLSKCHTTTMEGKQTFGVQRLREVIAAAVDQPYLLGQDGKNWKMDLPWLLDPANIAKVVRQKYSPSSNGKARRPEAPYGDHRARTRKLLKELGKDG